MCNMKRTQHKEKATQIVPQNALKVDPWKLILGKDLFHWFIDLSFISKWFLDNSNASKDVESKKMETKNARNMQTLPFCFAWINQIR